MASWSLDERLVKAVHSALKLLHRERELGEHALAELTVTDEQRSRDQLPDTPLARAAALRGVLEEARLVMTRQDPEAAALLEQRFWQGRSVTWLASEQFESESSFYARQSQAIQALARTLWDLEQDSEAAAAARRRHLTRNLPPASYTRLFGLEDAFNRLRAALTDWAGPWMVSIEGLGGLGKTALAHQLAMWAAGSTHFADITWETAQQERFAIWSGVVELPEAAPALTYEALLDSIAVQLGYVKLARLPLPQKETQLRAIFKAEPHLMVVDNLETVTDHEALLPHLWKLANPTRFLITSRHSLGHHPHVLCLTLNQLSEADSLAFIRYEGEERGIAAIAKADERRLHRIYSITGGHPLAIKLVVGQARGLPLERALSRLSEATGRRASELYRFIYWRSWEMLDEAARRVLLAMPALAASGGYWENLVAVSDLSEHELERAVQDLVRMSLLDVSGTEEKRYTIHRLTYTFIMSDLLGTWGNGQ